MSSQPSLISVAEETHVQRPESASQWQLFRDTAVAGSGTYSAMNEAGVVEPIGGAGGSNAIRSYKATLTQAGTAAPVATVLQNNLGGVPVYARTAAGIYTLTLAGAFPVDANVLLIPGSPLAAGQTIVMDRTSANVITITTNIAADTAADDLLSNTGIIIEVYPAA